MYLMYLCIYIYTYILYISRVRGCGKYRSQNVLYVYNTLPLLVAALGK